MKINEKIRQLREINLLSQEEMADKLGMSVTGYAKIERGEVRSNLPRLEQISEVFNMDICELLAYGDKEKIYFNNTVTDSTNSNSFWLAVGNENLEQVIQQLQLMLSHKDELIAQKDKIIAGLERENSLLQRLSAVDNLEPDCAVG